MSGQGRYLFPSYSSIFTTLPHLSFCLHLNLIVYNVYIYLFVLIEFISYFRAVEIRMGGRPDMDVIKAIIYKYIIKIILA